MLPEQPWTNKQISNKQTNKANALAAGNSANPELNGTTHTLRATRC